MQAEREDLFLVFTSAPCRKNFYTLTNSGCYEFPLYGLRIPLLKVLVSLGGSAKPSEIYPEVEKMMGLNPSECPGEYKEYNSMRTKESLINEIEEVPEPLLTEVLDFVHFLKAKIVREKLDVTIMSESSLSKDWLKPEEDEAWQNL